MSNPKRSSTPSKTTVAQRIISLFMCLVLTASLFVTAFAANETGSEAPTSPEVVSEEVIDDADDVDSSEAVAEDEQLAIATDSESGEAEEASEAEDSYKSFVLTGGITVGAMIVLYILIELKTRKGKSKPVKKKIK